jgi:hypothetical protein
VFRKKGQTYSIAKYGRDELPSSNFQVNQVFRVESMGGGVILEEDFQIKLNTRAKPVRVDKLEIDVGEKPPEKTVKMAKKQLASASLTSMPFFSPLASSSMRSSKIVRIRSRNAARPSFLDDDSFLNENFDINFANVNQSPHLFLIGSCMEVALNSCSSSSTATANTATTSTCSSSSSSSNNADQTQTEFISNNQANINGNSDGNYDSLCFFKQVNHLNVDGFEWDLI